MDKKTYAFERYDEIHEKAVAKDKEGNQQLAIIISSSVNIVICTSKDTVAKKPLDYVAYTPLGFDHLKASIMDSLAEIKNDEGGLRALCAVRSIIGLSFDKDKVINI